MHHPPWPNIHKAIWFQRTICKACFRIKTYRNRPDATPTRQKKRDAEKPTVHFNRGFVRVLGVDQLIYRDLKALHLYAGDRHGAVRVRCSDGCMIYGGVYVYIYICVWFIYTVYIGFVLLDIVFSYWCSYVLILNVALVWHREALCLLATLALHHSLQFNVRSCWQWTTNQLRSPATTGFGGLQTDFALKIGRHKTGIDYDFSIPVGYSGRAHAVHWITAREQTGSSGAAESDEYFTLQWSRPRPLEVESHSSCSTTKPRLPGPREFQLLSPTWSNDDSHDGTPHSTIFINWGCVHVGLTLLHDYVAAHSRMPGGNFRIPLEGETLQKMPPPNETCKILQIPSSKPT